EVEAILLRRAVAGEKDHEGIFRLNLHGEISKRFENVGFGRVTIIQRDDFDALVGTNLRLLQFGFCRKVLRISDRILQVVLRVSILIHTDSQDISDALALEVVGTGYCQSRVTALDVVLIKGISRQPVFTRDNTYLGCQRYTRATFENVTVPDLYQRAIAKQTHVLRSGWCRSDFNLEWQALCRHRVCDQVGTHGRQFQLRLPPIFLGDRFREPWSPAIDYIGVEIWIVKLVKEYFRRRSVVEFIGKAPTDLLPPGGGSVEITVRRDHQPIIFLKCDST